MAYLRCITYNVYKEDCVCLVIKCMDLTFENGSPQQPRGHALLYFRVSTEPDKVYATYVVALPVKADLSKYVPPFLASHLGNLPLNDFSAFAMPPVPEPVDGYEELVRLSRLRGDDLIFGSSMFSFDLPRMMEAVTEAVQAYSQLYIDALGGTGAVELEPAVGLEAAEQGSDVDRSYEVNEVLFSLMSERDKLGELSRLLGKLRFAVDGQDAQGANEVNEEISTLARHLPDEFQVPSLLAVAQDTSQRGSMLAQLYLDRCFRLSDGDINSAQDLEEQIRTLQGPE